MTRLEIELSIIIDNIDTASDLAKDNDKLYRNLIHNQLLNFRKIVSGDGYNFYEVDKNVQS